MTEAEVQTAIRLRASELGIPLFRNNRGACEDKTGRVIRYGLANDSAKLDKVLKSSDLIGVLPKFVRLGGSFPTTRLSEAGFGAFLSVECKRSDWQGGWPKPIDPAKFNAREVAQQAWINLIREHGGVAGFARCVEEFEELIRC